MDRKFMFMSEINKTLRLINEINTSFTKEPIIKHMPYINRMVLLSDDYLLDLAKANREISNKKIAHTDDFYDIFEDWQVDISSISSATEYLADALRLLISYYHSQNSK